MIRGLSSQIRRRRLASFALASAVTFMLLFVGIYTVLSEKKSSTTAKNKLLSHHSHRKLLNDGGKRKGDENVKEKRVEPTRIWSEKCSTSDIMISQGATEALPNGIPTYTVEIMNTCVSGCDISDIHLSCGWFSSARLVNPRVFKRLRFDDCLVNNGKPLLNGRTLSFQYANTFRYPLSVASVSC